MKKLVATIFTLSLFGCANYQLEQDLKDNDHKNCLGATALAKELKNSFATVVDDALLTETLGPPGQGKLCKGQVYRSKEGSKITLYRAWNSTNPNSEFGNWWAFQKPMGKVATYRAEYEICYQWSPLDKLTTCTLKPNTKIVVGTGQSATCSEFLRYPASAKQQVYLEDAAPSLIDCSTFDSEFRWK